MCHLLADMSVPAHVHNDAHSPFSEGGKDDYEQWAKSHYSPYNWEEALAQGGTLFDVTEKNYPIRYLMYVVNQYADFFPSDGDWSRKYHGDKNYSTTYSKNGKTDYYPILDEIFQKLGNPPTNINNSVQASHLIPFAIRATAGLLYLFAKETNMLPNTPKPLTASISGPYNLRRDQRGQYRCNASGGTGNYTYTWKIYKIALTRAAPSGYWINFGSQSSPTATKGIPNNSDYRDFKVKCIVSDGKRTVTSNIITTRYSWGGNSDDDPLRKISENNTLIQIMEVPEEYKLEGNYPNPFNPSTTIKYQLSEPGFVSLKIYDMLGREVANLVNEQKGVGFYETKFNASNLTSGIYFYTIRVNDYTASKKMILTK